MLSGEIGQRKFEQQEVGGALILMVIDYKLYPIPRVRHHVSSQAYLTAQQQQWAEWYPPTIDNISWSEVYGINEPARVIDLGCGRGGFLLRHALAHPRVPIIGLEIRKMLVDWINGVAEGERLNNVRALWYSIVNGLQWIESEVIDYTTYLFPDPWLKRRHFKRRAFSPHFLDEVYRVLKPGGRLYLATDRNEVDDFQRDTIVMHGGLKLIDMNDETAHRWPFAFKTDHQLFCERKAIPYTLYCAEK